MNNKCTILAMDSCFGDWMTSSPLDQMMKKIFGDIFDKKLFPKTYFILDNIVEEAKYGSLPLADLRDKQRDILIDGDMKIVINEINESLKYIFPDFDKIKCALLLDPNNTINYFKSGYQNIDDTIIEFDPILPIKQLQKMHPNGRFKYVMKYILKKNL